MAQIRNGAAPVITFVMVASSDHFSVLTGITPTVNISKNGGTFAASTNAATEIANGWYKVTLTATETNTNGDLSFHITGTGADPTQFKEQIVAFDPLAVAGLGLTNLDATVSSRFPTSSVVSDSGTAQAGAAGTITLQAGASAVTDFYIGQVVFLTGSTGAGQARVITAYNGSTKVATVSRNWATNPAGTTTYVVLAIENPKLDASLQVVSSSVQGNVTGSAASVVGAVGSVVGAVGSVTADVGITQAGADKAWGTATRALTDKAGFALSAGGVAAIWDALLTGITTASTIGKLIKDNLDATISSRLSTAGYTAPPSAVAIADQVWDEPIAGHDTASTMGNFQHNADVDTSTRLATAGYTAPPSAASISSTVWAETTRAITDKAGFALSSAGVAAIWDALLTGITTASTIGKLIKDNLDAAITTRSTHAAADIWAVGTRALTDKAGFALSAGGVAAIWDALLSGITTASTIGKLIKDSFDATVGSRLSTAGYTAPPSVDAIADQVWDEAISGHAAGGSTGAALSAATAPSAAAVADAVWDEAMSSHLTGGSTGASLNGAGSAGDPWTTALPGAYGAGTAGKIVGDNINATVSSRLPANGFTPESLSSSIALLVWSETTRALTDKSNFSLSTLGIQAIWDALTSALTTVGSVGKRIADNLDGTVSSRLATAGYTAPPAVGAVADAVWDEALAGHLAIGSAGATLVDAEGGAGGAADPPTPAEIADAVWDEAVIQHMALGSFGALVVDIEGGVGGSYGGPDLDAIAGAVWNEPTSDHLTAGSTGARLNAAAASALQAGAIQHVHTVYGIDGVTPLSDVDVWFTTDVAGSNVVASGRTNTSGQVTFMLDSGTYYAWRQRGGFNFTNPSTVVI